MNQKSVLIVDNDLIFIDIISNILLEEGYRIITARDGKEALAAILQAPPDVLFTDLIMPKISGEQLIRYIRDTVSLCRMVIVVVSGAILEYSGYEKIAADYFIIKSEINSFRKQILEVSQKISQYSPVERHTLSLGQTLKSRKIVKDLLDNRQYILQILDNIKAGLLVYDSDLRILIVNPAAEILLGKPANLILGTSVEDQFDSKYHISLLAIIKSGCENHSLPGDLSVVSSNKILDLHISHLKDYPQSIWQGGLVLIHDVTQLEKLHGYLESAARVASLLLKRENILNQTENVLEIMGRAAGASRSYWYKNGWTDGNIWMSLKAEWCAEGIRSHAANINVQRIYYDEGFSRWYQYLSTGRLISGAIDEFPEHERLFLHTLEIRSILIIPLLLNNRFEGFIGFDNCRTDTPWQDPEVNLLRLTTDSLAKALDYEASLDEKNKLQDQLMHSQRMKFMGEISAGLSHNFRNILTGIICNAELICLKYPDVAILQKHASSIINISRNGSDLISSLMKFSRMETKGPKRIMNLSDILEECYQIISTSFSKQIKIQKRWPPLLIVEGDASELAQVFMNLFTNARDAMPDGGMLQIDASKEKLQTIVIKVSDTGKGMSEDTIRRIFDPFFTTKESGKGTGLGLSTAYGIVHNHDGDINVISQPGLGTVFTVTLPSAVVESHQPQHSDVTLIRGHSEKILIVDDDESIFDVLKDLLEGYGYSVVTATSGTQAIDLYASCQPDIILLDRNMPVMNGVNTAKHLLAIDPEVRIIIASGYEADGPDGIPEYLRNVIKGYIVKPCEIAELLRLLSEVLKS